MKKKIYLYAILLIAAFNCRDPYNPTLNDAAARYLVIEGVINSGDTDTTLIKLSRTTNLSDKAVTLSSSNPEINAKISVEDGKGFSVAFRDLGHGNYSAPPLGLDHAKKYRLRIKTIDDKTYVSDLLDVLNTPPIDSIGFNVNGDKVQVYANAHDATNKTRYYRWEFTEAWKFNTPVLSEYVVKDKRDSIVKRTPEQMFPQFCWGSGVSYDINVGSSEKLTQDVIFQAPITIIPASAEKIMLRYSIEITQYALTHDAFIFWSETKRNTESLGSIFDAQPSASRSNIHCLENPTETVLGYMTISDIRKKRVFVNKSDLHISIPPITYSTCGLDTEYFCRQIPKCDKCQPSFVTTTCGMNDVLRNLMAPTAQRVPVKPLPGGGLSDGYFSSGLQCVDCSTRGAVKPPPFWKD